jgi:hypothetical protein
VLEAVASAAVRLTRNPDEGAGDPIELDGELAWQVKPRPSGRGTPPREKDHVEAREFTASRRGRPRGAPTTDELVEIAAIYRAAVTEGKAPTEAVKDAKHVSRAQASRWIARARAEGILGPARRGLGGEITTNEEQR